MLTAGTLLGMLYLLWISAPYEEVTDAAFVLFRLPVAVAHDGDRS